MTREHVTISVDGFLTVFGINCTEQDPVTNFRVTNDVIFVTVTANVRGNVTSVDAALDGRFCASGRGYDPCTVETFVCKNLYILFAEKATYLKKVCKRK
jgi:hypothetical protein